MIEYVLLIILGFCLGMLVALLIAPTVWHRAVRLTSRRLEATLPMSLGDIEADKDTLRATYAVRIRRLETALNKAREKSAVQLVEVSRLQVTIATLNEQIAMLSRQLDERGNAANVFEKTIKKRFPELETQFVTARAALDERAQEIGDLTVKLRRSDEAQTLARNASEMQQAEIRQLRDAMEKSGADNAGRFKKRPAQWTLEEYRSEYDRLSLELSKMREQLALSQRHETRQATALKTEMQQLAERLMASAATTGASSGGTPGSSSGEAKQPSPASTPQGGGRSASPARDTSPQRPPAHGERTLTAPQPWPKDRSSSTPSPELKISSTGETPSKLRTQSSAIGVDGHTFTRGSELYTSRKDIAPPVEMRTEDGTLDVTTPSGAHKPPLFESAATTGDNSIQPITRRTTPRVSIHAPAIAATEGAQPAAADTRAALKTLLDRTVKPAPRGSQESPDASFTSLFAPADPADTDASSLPAGPAAIPAGVSLASLAAQSAPAVAASTGDESAASVAPADSETHMDKVLREIFEGHPSDGGQTAEQAPVATQTESAASASASADSASPPKTNLLDRLRVFQG